MIRKSNRLISESSPYLLQHAYNPVDWYPWGQEALERAKKEDKPILLSIGYSACHWCHVMERESFEKQDIANLMNNHFVCIKLDREERPDIDHLYMDAIQAMGVHGGWPLNVFLTPRQDPFYGGTYFPPQHWAQLLVKIAQAFREHRDELENSALKFREALNVSIVDKYQLEEKSLKKELLSKAADLLKQQFDLQYGGTAKAPKFPMPVIWNFLLHFYAPQPDEALLKHLQVTLDNMARGGIYDQIGGGFARYSVDEKWFAPHFEKMLYDNAQLISLYAQAFALTGKPLYKKVCYQTIKFISRELLHKSGAFYAALDADSEGEEGKFYVWTYQEFEELAGSEAEFLMDYYGVTPDGNWEHGQNILHREVDDETFAASHQLDLTWMQNTILKYQDILLESREKRVRPGLDHKILCGWNGLMIKALTDAYGIFGEGEFLKLALTCAEFIESELREGDQLWRSHNTQNAKLPAYLEDYAAVIQGYLGLYQVTFQDRWIYKAQNLTAYVMDNFLDEKENLFFYTDEQSQGLIARKKEIFDNVIPASNSIMAQNLIILGTLLQRNSYLALAEKMISKVGPLMETDPAYLSNWATAYSFLANPLAEVAIAGAKPELLRKPLAAHFHPHKIILGTDTPSDLPGLRDRLPQNGTLIYVCYDQTCQLPTDDAQIAIEQLSYPDR